MGSGRCLSSASPISAAERQQLWGSAIHHSFDDRPVALSTRDMLSTTTWIRHVSAWVLSFEEQMIIVLRRKVL
ncbi:unnamed protein product [Caenorhabditis auriculariae]|uniref:Uncharacterized protein n=1 Tax=Caenorhabditis auriculariae TaxID=2777116 RepID=A0A8S1HUZ8_9PELO|nr:unnamed protein product [Caenorhabditis auriculariae]